MSNKYVEMIVPYSTDSEINVDNLDLSKYQKIDLYKIVGKINCAEVSQQGDRRNPTIVKRLFSRRDGAPRTNCSGCPALDTCSDFLNADARDAQKDLPDFSFHEINNNFIY